jgi:hypothetical protein
MLGLAKWFVAVAFPAVPTKSGFLECPERSTLGER